MNTTTIQHGLRATVYALTPQETYFAHVKDTPNIVAEALLLVFISALLEGIVIHVAGHHKQWNLHNVIINGITGSLVIAWNSFFFRGLELAVYFWCYENLRLITFAWNSLWTYIITALGVDFCTYWWHRGSHEISFLWAAHSSHHSGEDFNMSLGTRISGVVRFSKWMFYVPLGVLGVPPSAFVVHSQMNFVFGSWSHMLLFPKTYKLIPGLGHLLEFFFVTPSHHRVHHGVNKYCLDKNYGSFLIIWDRIFGTFVEEREDEPITYGTITPVNTHDILNIQLKPMRELFRKMLSMKNAQDKVKSFLYGPAWSPGTPRLGDENEIPDVTGRKKSELSLPLWLNIYTAVHGALVIFTVHHIGLRVKLFSRCLSLLNFALILLSSLSLGGLYEGNSYSLWLEPLRLLSFAVACNMYPVFSCSAVTTWVLGLCLCSLLLWPSMTHHLRSLAKKK